MKNALFEKISRFEAPVEEVFKWHARPGAIERYTPPWDPIKVVKRSGGIEKGATVVIRMKAGPVPIFWHARHTEYVENRLFQDIQVKGPFMRWVHTHEFESDGPNACYLKDSISYRLLPHPFRQSISYRMVEKKLSGVFAFRHDCLKHDLRVQLGYGQPKPKTILITGSSGMIGTDLGPFLTTAGHQVKKLVRRKPVNHDEIFWDPPTGQLDPGELEGVDAVIHLAGENIGHGRWTDKKKALILSSRINGTRLLVQTFKKMKKPPEVFLSASAIGYYGDRGDTVLSESSGPGDDYISDVCQIWEKEAEMAEENGIRTAVLRIGVVLDPRGGALKELLPVFRMGVETKLSPGLQYVSWIGLNDTIDAIYHLLCSPGVHGPVNIVGPKPVISDEMTSKLAKMVGSKVALKIPGSGIKVLFGQKGEEVLLSSTRVMPDKLLDSGFVYRRNTLDQLYNTIFGKVLNGKDNELST